MSKVSIDGREYDPEQLSESARGQLVSIQFADQKINQLQQELALIQTARSAYFHVLQSELKKTEDWKVTFRFSNATSFFSKDLSFNDEFFFMFHYI